MGVEAVVDYSMKKGVGSRFGERLPSLFDIQSEDHRGESRSRREAFSPLILRRVS